jgi:hypothetical protein
MAVYKRTYRGYSGPITETWSRFLVLFRYSRRNLFRSKFLTAFFVLCFFFPLLCGLGIYANDHLSAFSFLGQRGGPLFKVDGRFFLLYLSIQTSLAFILTAFIGPGLVSPDLANGALTLYLCRPLSRVEYVIGKLSVLAIVLSWITWIPGLLLFFIQASLSGWDCQRPCAQFLALDYVHLSFGTRSVRLGQVAHCGGCTPLGRSLSRRSIFRSRQSRSPNTARLFVERLKIAQYCLAGLTS